MKKIILFLLLSMAELHIIGLSIDPKNSIFSSRKDAASMIYAMEKSLQDADKYAFANFLDTYINHFGQVYEKQADIFEAYKTVYYISSYDDQFQPLTAAHNILLLQVLDKATKQTDWGKSLILQLPVLNLKTSTSTIKSLTFDEIKTAIKRIPLPDQYLQAAIVTGAALGALAVAGVLYYFTQRNSAFIQQANDMIAHRWEDLQDTMHQTSKYLTGPHTYEQFEKQHDLLSEGMTKNERNQRFKEWQTGEQIQQNINSTMKEVKRFEKKLNLSSESMRDEDRINIFKKYKQQEQQMQRFNEKMKPVKQFEKQHDLLSEDMTENERLKRWKEWKQGHAQQKVMHEKMKSVKMFEKQHGLLSQHITEDERLQRFKEWQKGDQQQKIIDDKMKQVEKFEDENDLSSQNMHYENRIKRFEAAQKIKAHEKIMHGVEKWQAQLPDWWRDELVDKSDEERIKEYMCYVNPIRRYILENE